MGNALVQLKTGCLRMRDGCIKMKSSFRYFAASACRLNVKKADQSGTFEQKIPWCRWYFITATVPIISAYC